MSTITLKNNAAYRENKKTLKERIADYFAENYSVIVLGMYAASGRIPDIEMLRAMKIMQWQGTAGDEKIF